MKDWKQATGPLPNTLGLVVAASMTAAIVLMSAGEYNGSTRPLATDANEQRGGLVSIESAPAALPPNAPYDDPELRRLDHANDHHG